MVLFPILTSHISFILNQVISSSSLYFPSPLDMVMLMLGFVLGDVLSMDRVMVVGGSILFPRIRVQVMV